MTFFVHIADNGAKTYPVAPTDMRLMFPNVSFPAQISVEDAAMFGCFPVKETMPPLTSQFQTAERASAELVDGEWIEQWSITEWTDEQIAVATEQQWSAVRDERNVKLAASDWTQLPDCPLDNTAQTEWAIYRQGLRDITDQADPFAITWPLEP